MVSFGKVVTGAIVISSLAFGAENAAESPQMSRRSQNAPRQGFNGGQRRGGFGFGGNMFARFIAEKQLQEKFPKEMEALNKQLLEIEAKYEALAKQAKVDLPINMETKLRRLRAAKPAEFAKIEAQLKENPRNAMRELNQLAQSSGIQLFPQRPNRQNPMDNHKPNGPAKREMARPNFARLRKKYPEEMAKYEELRKTKPAEAKTLLQELVNKSFEQPKK